MTTEYYHSGITLRGREDAIGSKKNWNKWLYTDVALNGMSKEEAMQNHNYDDFGKWGQKRFHEIYDSLIEQYNAGAGLDAKGKEIEVSTQIVYILMALAIGLVIAFVFIRLTKKKK